MFVKNGKYILNEDDERIFNRQLPSTSVKIGFKQHRQKILNINQQKLQIDLIRQQIYNKCKLQQLQYISQLAKQKQQMLKRKQQKMKINLIQYTNKKNINLRSSRNQYQLNDSIDYLIVDNNERIQNSKPKLQFSLEPTPNKKIQKLEQIEWIHKVRKQRQKLRQKIGNYYDTQLTSNRIIGS